MSDPTTPPLTVPRYHGTEDREPPVIIKRESSRHRYMLNLLARNVPVDQVAELMGYSESWISIIRNQPWALEYVATLQYNSGQAASQAKTEKDLRDLSDEAVEILAAAMRADVDKGFAQARAADRIAAAKEVLSRAWPGLGETKPQKSLEEMTSEELQAIAKGRSNN